MLGRSLRSAACASRPLAPRAASAPFAGRSLFARARPVLAQGTKRGLGGADTGGGGAGGTSGGGGSSGDGGGGGGAAGGARGAHLQP